MSTWNDTDWESPGGIAGNDGWGTDYGGPVGSGLEIVTDQSFSPTHSLRGTWTNITGSASQPNAWKYFPAPVDRFYARWMQRVGSGFLIASNGLTKQPRFYCNNGFTTWLLYYNGAAGTSNIFEYLIAMEHVYGNTDVFLFHTGVVPRFNQWDQLEVYCQMNSPGVANGIVQFWVNGVQCVNQTALEIRGPSLTSTDLFNTGGFAVPSNETWDHISIFIQSGVGNVWYDRIAMGDTRPVSLIGGADTTPPSTPTGVTVS